MGKLLYGVIHCSDTKPSFDVTLVDLLKWHTGPLDRHDRNGKFIGVHYLGRMWNSREDLPEDKIGGVPVKLLNGRGWDRLGYSDFVHRDGTIENLTPYDDDHLVQSHEMTWGAAGVNANARHVCLEGGRNDSNKGGVYLFDEIYTDAQFTSLISWVNDFLKKQPQAKIAGHNIFSDVKTCPNFNVSGLMILAGISPNRLITEWPK